MQDLVIDPEAQRKLSVPWVKAHIAEFDVDQLGYIVVNRRANGKLYVVDGQHRVELMRAVGWGDQSIHAELFEGLTQKEEAALFLARNDRRAVSPYANFRVSVTAGEEIECGIEKIVNDHGLVVSDTPRDGHIAAVAALRRVYVGGGIASPKEGPSALGKTLTTVVQAWGRSPGALNGSVVHGLGLVYLRYNGAIDSKDLQKKLAPIPMGAQGLLSRGRTAHEITGRPVHHCIASVVVDLYNKGRSRNRLDRWEE